MTAVNTQMMASMCAVSNQGISQTQSEVANESTSFKDVFSEAMPVCDETAISTDCETKADVKELITKLLQTISGDCSEQDLQQLTDGLSDEQLKMLTKIIGKLTQLISNEVKTTDQAGEQNSSENSLVNILVNGTAEQSDLIQIDSKSHQKNETDEDVIVSDEVISSVAQIISDVSGIQFQEVSDSVNKTTENIAPIVIDKTSENLQERQAQIQNVLSNLSDKVTESNPKLSEFATKLQNVSQEISKSTGAFEEQLSEIKITDIKLTTNSQPEQNILENSLLSKGSLAKPLIKVVKSDGELSEITALTGDVKTDFTAMPVEQAETMQAPPETQVLNFIKTQVLPSANEVGTTEMKMTLNPEQLGEISVKLAKTGTELTVAITCNNSITQQMIENRLPQLISSLTSGENQTVDISVVTPNQNASEFMSNFTNSQQNGQQHLEYQQTHSHYVGDNEIQDNSDEAEDFYREGRLWQTI